MNNLIVLLAMAIIVILVYRVWEPFVNAPKRDVPVGKAKLYFFYTDWCGFSQKAMPEWEALEEKVSNTPYFGTTKVETVRVNAEKDRATALLYEVHGFPTIKLETSSLLRDYEGNRSADSLMKFLRETLGKERSSL